MEFIKIWRKEKLPNKGYDYKKDKLIKKYDHRELREPRDPYSDMKDHIILRPKEKYKRFSDIPQRQRGNLRIIWDLMLDNWFRLFVRWFPYAKALEPVLRKLINAKWKCELNEDELYILERVLEQLEYCNDEEWDIMWNPLNDRSVIDCIHFHFIKGKKFEYSVE